MKKGSIQNVELSKIVARMGHGDIMLIGDVGCPFPVNDDKTEIIDLALTDGIPKVEDVLKAVLDEMVTESYIICEEMEKMNPEHLARYKEIISKYDNKGNPIAEDKRPHLDIKSLWVNGDRDNHGANTRVRTFVRTGERSPYAYIMLVAGVDF